MSRDAEANAMSDPMVARRESAVAVGGGRIAPPVRKPSGASSLLDRVAQTGRFRSVGRPEIPQEDHPAERYEDIPRAPKPAPTRTESLLGVQSDEDQLEIPAFLRRQ